MSVRVFTGVFQGQVRASRLCSRALTKRRQRARAGRRSGSSSASIVSASALGRLSPAVIVATLIAGAAGFGLLVLAVPAASAAEGTCPNEAIRIEQGSTYLPECRAYEMVSPPGEVPYIQQGSLNIEGAQAAADGDAIGWFSYYPIEGSHGAFFNLSRRGATGWSTEPAVPALSTENGDLFACSPSVYYNGALTHSILEDGVRSNGLESNPRHEGGEEGFCANNDPPLVENEPQGFQNVFIRDLATGAYQLANLTPAGVTPANANFQNASADFSRVYFEEEAKLTAGAPSGSNLYEWVGGAVHLVGVLPSGAATNASIVYAVHKGACCQSPGPFLHSVSDDGKTVFFTAEGKLYARIDPEAESELKGARDAAECGAEACTLQIDASQAGGPGGGGQFLAANAQGTKVFFTDSPEAKLTSDTQAGSGQNLYLYDLETGQLTDLTPTAQAQVVGVSGIAEDGSYLYFVAEGALASGATAGRVNLYVTHEGATSFVATLSERDSFDWNTQLLKARTSANGRYIAFTSVERLTGYNNEDVATGQPDSEIFLYDAASAKLNCVSCNPDGSKPVGSAELQDAQKTFNTWGPAYLQREVFNDGRVFFNSPDPLVAGDVNGVPDVYEYADGVLHLISSGTSSFQSEFYDASETGEDVFFATAQGLVGRDTDNAPSLYDARVNGGFAEPLASPSCSGEGCRAGLPGSAPLSSPSSVSFSGEGNLAPPASSKSSGKSHKVTKLTRRQKLVKALKACRHWKNRHKRRLCKRRARRRYAAKAARRHRGSGRKARRHAGSVRRRGARGGAR